MNILGIETSCDDTGVAVVEARADGRCKILANVVVKQNHVATGGVVPETAARHHAVAITPALSAACRQARLTICDIDCVAVTRGPGLIPCLLVGVEAAKTLALTRHLPIIGVNHLAAHIAATYWNHPRLDLPALVLLVSGGHTMLVVMNKRNEQRVIGSTCDDAAGEAFDKVAKMLGLPYPGGPQIARLARRGNPRAIPFPRPMIHSGDFNFSFAGLKTAVLYYIRRREQQQKKLLTATQKTDIAASFQESVIEVLLTKTLAAATQHGARTVILAGGVSANQHLRAQLRKVVTASIPDAIVLTPAPKLFTDNGAMVALAAAPHALKKDFDSWRQIKANPNLSL